MLSHDSPTKPSTSLGTTPISIHSAVRAPCSLFVISLLMDLQSLVGPARTDRLVHVQWWTSQMM